MSNVAVLDLPRGPLRKAVSAARKSGLAFVFLHQTVTEEELESLRPLKGIIVHHGRSREIARLAPGFLAAGIPILVWYPSHTPRKEIFAWSKTSAADFWVGPVNADGLAARLDALHGNIPALRPWRRAAMQALFKINRALTSWEDDLAVLTTTAREIEGLFPGTQCSILMLSPATGIARVVTQGNTDRLLDIPLDLSRYPEIQKVAATRRSVAVRDVKRNPMMKEVRDLIKSKDLKSVLAVPIFYRDEVTGLIMVRSITRARSFSKLEIALCETIAQNAAVAIRNVKMGQEMAEEVRRVREAKKEVRRKQSDLARMEDFFEHASDGIVVVGDDGAVRGINVNFIRLSGFKKEEVEGKHLDELLKPAPGESTSVARAIRDKDSAHRSNQVLHRKDGGRLSVAVRMEFLARNREWLISLHDVTEERQLEEALRRTKDFLENMIQSSMDAIMSADMKGTIIVFNRAAEEISGFQAEEVIGKKNIVDFYAPGVARDIMRKLRSDQYGGKGRLETTFNELIGRDGQTIPINMSASIIYEEGREVATVGIFQDQRERIKIEKELRSAQEKLTASQQRETLSALSGAAAHELNQPLTSIMGYAEVLKRIERNLARDLPAHPAVASLKNAADVIDQESERMAGVVRKLGKVTSYETRDYVGGAKIIDLDRAGGEGGGRPDFHEPVIAQMEEAVIVMGEDTVIRFANPAAVAICEENPAGKSFTRYFEGVKYTRAMELFTEIKSGKTAGFELEGKAATGAAKIIKGTALPLPGGKEFLLVFADVTMRRRAEQQVRDLSAFHDQLTRNATLPLVAFDLDGKITYWNRAAENLLGFTFEEVRGKVPDFVIHKFDYQALLAVLRMVRREGEHAGELILTRRSGEKVRVWHVDSVMRDDEGRAMGFLSMLFDFSEQRVFEEQLKEKTEHLAFITDIAESVRTGVGLDDMLGGILRKLGRFLPFDHASISLTTAEENLFLAVHYNQAEDSLDKNTLRFYEDAPEMRRLIFPDRPQLIGDLTGVDESFLAGDVGKGLARIKDLGMRSLINYPLVFGNETVGSLQVLSHEKDRFSENEIKKIAQVAGPITIATAQARMFGQIERQNIDLTRRTAWMEDLIRAGQGIGLDMRVSELVSRLLEPYSRAHPIQHISVWLTEQGSDRLRLATTYNYPDLDLSRANKQGEGFYRLAGDGGAALEVDVEAVTTVKPFLEGARGALIVPIVAPDRRLGMILLESHHRMPFTEGEKVEVQILAANIAGALRNLYFYRDLDLALRFQRGLLEDANALIIAIGKEGKVNVVNRAMAELLGRPSDSFVGMTYQDFFGKFLHIEIDPHGAVTSGDKSFKKLLKGVLKGESMVNIRVTIRSMDGIESRAIFNTSSILDREGGYQGFIAIGQNITRYQQLEANLLQAEKMATVGQMAAGIAHDLNNPLTGLINAATMIQRHKGLDEKARALVEQIQEGAQRIDALAQNLMSYSRPSKEQIFPINLRQMILDSLTFSHYELSRGRVVVNTKIPDDLPPVAGIKNQIQQVFINLLTNASHACAEKGGGTVSISARALTGAVEVKVSDNGAGIPAENQKRIFDPFFTTKPEGKGTGLGLTIVREIVSRHHGSIDVQSEPGQGSAFTVSLPVWKE